ncbi:protein PYRICULARIA ORYZAE RESISTANCE 21-like [Nymphaea colorata]|nr:protein PYRICULARIA ORYZAE RESISTANCE 21-like [Nymphaea colorata]
MSTKVYSIVIKAKLDCCRCHEKIKKAICSLCVCEINSKSFDEKSNKITLIGTFDPKKVIKKICQKASKCIDSIEVSEVISKTPDSDAESKKKDPPPPPVPKEEAGGAKEKAKAGGKKDGAKEKDKRKDPPSPELVGPVLVVVVPPPAPAPAPKPPPTVPADPPKKPEREVIACVPVALPVGAPVGCCHCGPSHCGCYYRPCPWPGYETRPCTCGCSNRSHPCSISRQHGCPGNCVVFSEEDSTCKTM